MTLDDTFLLGYAYLKEENYPEALVCFRKLIAKYEEDRSADVPARLLSYYGLALALGEHRVKEGVSYCTTAIKKEFYHTEFYVNLARVYSIANRRYQAVSVLYKGLKIDTDDPVILEELQKLGIRRKPVLGFLGRGNVVNKYLGLILSRLQGRERSSPRKP